MRKRSRKPTWTQFVGIVVFGDEAGDGSREQVLVEQEQHFVDEVSAHRNEFVCQKKRFLLKFQCTANFTRYCRLYMSNLFLFCAFCPSRMCTLSLWIRTAKNLSINRSPMSSLAPVETSLKNKENFLFSPKPHLSESLPSRRSAAPPFSVRLRFFGIWALRSTINDANAEKKTGIEYFLL